MQRALGNVENNAFTTVNHHEAASEPRPHNKSVKKRDAPRKRSEPIPSYVRSAATASASVSCPAGFTIPVEPDPVCHHLYLLLLLLQSFKCCMLFSVKSFARVPITLPIPAHFFPIPYPIPLYLIPIPILSTHSIFPPHPLNPHPKPASVFFLYWTWILFVSCASSACHNNVM